MFRIIKNVLFMYLSFMRAPIEEETSHLSISYVHLQQTWIILRLCCGMSVWITLLFRFSKCCLQVHF